MLKKCLWCNEFFEAVTPAEKRQKTYCNEYCKKEAYKKRKNDYEKMKRREEKGEFPSIDPYYLRRGNPNKIYNRQGPFEEG